MFDTEYTEDTHNILFIRNTVSYKISDRFSLHNGFGVKNPGAFFLSYLQYQYKNKQNTLNISYSAGATYQAGFTLEQSFLIEYTPKLTQKLNAFFRLSAVGNTDFNEYTRGFQHIRIGLKDEKLMYGLAFNAEQFNISWDHLENLGVFVKYNF
ncbi:hypothetical protein NWE55_01070 [Myroides albus]|uniref:hypothetical protein n=1 Tax=Myroides albus TaxID=2562892 RepID=UPI0021595409|nr:hypothetical protein [Myroides albus]UVD79912.1 hypothetical protein NWE55_01070 [Myroides albus]